MPRSVKCAMCAQVSSVAGKDRHFFKCPSEESRKSLWEQFLAQAGVKCDTKHFYLCDDHFAERSFTSTLRRRLSKVAVPEVLEKNN